MTAKLLKFLASSFYFSLLMGILFTSSSLFYLKEISSFSLVRIIFSVFIGISLSLLVFGFEFLFYRKLQGKKLVIESKYKISELWKWISFVIMIIALISQDSPYAGFIFLSWGVYLLNVSLIFYFIRNHKAIVFE